MQKILDENHFIDNGSGIYEAYLPFKSLTGHDEFRWDDLKEIRFKIMDGTQFEIGDFQIIEFRGNPKNQPNGKEYKFTFMLHVVDVLCTNSSLSVE